MRFCAAIAVVLYHYGFRAFEAHGLAVAEWPALGEIARYGYLGVELFFMISGFVILLSAQNSRHWTFLRSRFIRIFPAYWLAVSLTTAILFLWGTGKFTVSAWQYVVNLTMLQKPFGFKHVDGVYWTLVVEIKFYLLIWLLVRFDGLSKLRMWLWIWLSISTLTLVLPEKGANRLESLLLADWAPYFSVGIASFLLHTSDKKTVQDWLALCISGLLATYIGSGEAAELSVSYGKAISPAIVAIIIASFVTLFALVACNVTTVLRKPILAHAGALTYPLYLLHAFIGYTIMQKFGGETANPYFILTLAIAMIVFAWLFYRHAEQPLAKLLKQFWKK